MKLYKLTDAFGKTRGGTQWGAGVTHTAQGSPDLPLCTYGWIHAYEHPLVAVFMNPIHGGYKNPLMWEAEGEVEIRELDFKCGCRALTTIRQMALPVITREQRVRFAIGCAWPFNPNSTWKEWAVKWLTGQDRLKLAVWSAWARSTWAAPWAARAAAAAAAAADAEVAMSAARAAREEEEVAISAARAADARSEAIIAVAEWAVTDLPIDALEEAGQG
jgi:hypothetical protein